MRRVLVALLLAAPAFAAPVTYTLDPAKTELLAFTEPTGIFKGASHSHVIRAEQVTGSIIYDADEINTSRVSVSFPVASLVVDEPPLRTREGMTTMPTERDRDDVTKTMRSAKQLDQKRFPEISFDSTRVVKEGPGRIEVTGRIGIHGVRKTITLPVLYTVTDKVFRGEGTVTLSQQDFAIEPYTAVMGTVRNADPIRLKIVLVGTAQAASDLSLETLMGVKPADGGR